MALYTTGFQTREGLEVCRLEEGKDPEIIKIRVEKIGNSYQPSRTEMKKLFLDQIKEGDIVLVPGGNTFELSEALLQRTANSYWLPAQKLTLQRGETVSLALIRLWKENPRIFYAFETPDVTVRRIRRLLQELFQAERERIALENRNTALLRRLRDDLLLLDLSEEEFVADYVTERQGIVMRILRSLGQRPQKKKLSQILGEWGFSSQEIEEIIKNWEELRPVLDAYPVSMIEAEGRELYRLYKEERIDRKKQAEIESKINEAEYRILLAREEELSEKIKEYLEKSPFDKIITSIPGVGPKGGAVLVGFIRNPLMYPTCGHLLKYFNLVWKKGRRRSRFEAVQEGGACFEAEMGLWQWSNQMGLFQNPETKNLYRAFKLWAWLTYFDLVELSKEIFERWEEKEVEGEKVREWAGRLLLNRSCWPLLKQNKEAQARLRRIWGSGSGQELARILKKFLSEEEMKTLQIDLEGLEKEEDHYKVKEIAKSLLLNLKNEKMVEKLVDIVGTGSWEELKEVVSRGQEDIQMTPIRIEKMARRAVAINLVRQVYYNWLEAIGVDIAPIIALDGQYSHEAKKVGANPYRFKMGVVAEFFVRKAREKAQELGYKKIEDIPSSIRKFCGEEEIKEILVL